MLWQAPTQDPRWRLLRRIDAVLDRNDVTYEDRRYLESAFKKLAYMGSKAITLHLTRAMDIRGVGATTSHKPTDMYRLGEKIAEMFPDWFSKDVHRVRARLKRNEYLKIVREYLEWKEEALLESPGWNLPVYLGKFFWMKLKTTLVSPHRKKPQPVDWVHWRKTGEIIPKVFPKTNFYVFFVRFRFHETTSFFVKRHAFKWGGRHKSLTYRLLINHPQKAQNLCATDVLEARRARSKKSSPILPPTFFSATGK